MEEQYLDESFNSGTLNNMYSDSNLWRLRLDTQALWEDIELFLTCQKVVEVYADDGTRIKKKIRMGNPRANTEGVHAIMNMVQSLLNPSVVQGNMTPVDYYSHLKRIHVNIATEITYNLYEWDIKESDIMGIPNFIMSISIPFLSRTINNKERESYTHTLKSVQTIQDRVQSRGGFFGEK